MNKNKMGDFYGVANVARTVIYPDGTGFTEGISIQSATGDAVSSDFLAAQYLQCLASESRSPMLIDPIEFEDDHCCCEGECCGCEESNIPTSGKYSIPEACDATDDGEFNNIIDTINNAITRIDSEKQAKLFGENPKKKVYVKDVILKDGSRLIMMTTNPEEADARLKENYSKK